MSVQSYGALTVVRDGDEVRIDGEIPNRIGVDRGWIANPPVDFAGSGSWSMIDGELTILHTRWRQIGTDGDMTVFERTDA